MKCIIAGKIVNWPDDLTRERLLRLEVGYNAADRDDALHRLAFIAPTTEEVAPVQEEVKRWCWTDETGAIRIADNQPTALPHAVLVTFPRKPRPGRREVVLWKHKDGTQVWMNELRLDGPDWRKVGMGLVGE